MVLSEPYQPWMYFLTKYMGIFPEGSRQQFGDMHFRSSLSGVGTGGGMFEESRLNDHISFRANPKHWRAPPAWDRLMIRFIPAFWLGIVLIRFAAVDLRWLPPGGFVPLSAGLWTHLATLLPASSWTTRPRCATRRAGWSRRG